MAITPAVPRSKPRRKVVGSLNKPATSQKAKRAPRQPTQQVKGCPDCGPDVPLRDDGQGNKVCTECFSEIISASNIVAEVEFQEDSRGAAQVQGGYVGGDARHAKGSAAQRRLAGSDRSSGQVIEANGKRALDALCPQLGIQDAVKDQALAIYRLAYGIDFFKGRRSEEVVAACLYAACRRTKDNAVLFVDIAELQRVNVFRLGEVYKDLCQELYLKEENVGTQYLIEVESLVMRYCSKLEFGDHTRDVVNDTVKIIRRMKRDWITPGRHPGGLCGAAIILAARMNNFRRSVRELVYVAKVADATLAKRVEEFRRTKAAALTVDQFREYGNRLKQQHDPPIVYESQLRKDKLEAQKRKRQEAKEAREVIEISDDGSATSSRESSVATPSPAPLATSKEGPQRKRRRTSTEQPAKPAPTQQQLRLDADGFAIPPLPVDLTDGNDENENENSKPRRGRRKKIAPEPIVITDEELVAEADFEDDINKALNDQDIVDSRNELEQARDEERAKALAGQKKKDDSEKLRSEREKEGFTWLDKLRLSDPAEITADDLEEVFADDPEVQNCLLTETEQKIKEQIWIRHNEDWLRAQHEKAVTAAKDDGKKRKEPKKRKKQSVMGDGTTLAEATTPIETPADATAVMLEKRAPAGQSKYIDYTMLRRVYGDVSTSPSIGTSRHSETPSVSGTGADGSPLTVRGAEAERSPSATPTPAPRNRTVRLQSPPQTQIIDDQAAALRTTSPATQPEDIAPLSPPQTQTQAHAGAEEYDSDDPDDYIQDDDGDDSPPGSPLGWEGNEDDDREDIGEDDYRRAIDPTGKIAMDEDYF